MKLNELDESLIYDTKIIFDKIRLVEEGAVSLSEWPLDNLPEIPKGSEIKKQILSNLEIHRSPAQYLERLKNLFPHLPALIETMLEKTYEYEKTLKKLLADVGCYVDFSEKGHTHFYFGENYEKINVYGREELIKREYMTGSTGTRFSSAAQMYFYYSKGNYPEPALGQKTDGDLLSLLEMEYNILSTDIYVLGELLDAAESIQEAIQEAEDSQQQPATAEPANHHENNQQQFQPHKLQWNGSNRSLYHLFAQLLETKTRQGKPLLNHTPETVAKFLVQSFPQLKGVDGVTREIQKYLPQKGQPPENKPPNGAIFLDEVDFDPDLE